jgi:DNA-binding Lrp family transcriptional regulator
MLGTSEATIRRRIRSMMDKGIIAGFSTYIDYSLIENPVKAYIHLKVRTEKMESVDQITQHAACLIPRCW